MDVPSEIAIKATLRQGAVYYMTWKTFSSPEPHYFVILNIDPHNNPDIAIVCAVSDVNKAEKRCRIMGFNLNTLVKVTPKDCPFLDHDSVFDCNYVQTTDIPTLIDKLEKNEIRKLAKDITLNPLVLNQIIQATCNSTLVAQEIKDLIK